MAPTWIRESRVSALAAAGQRVARAVIGLAIIFPSCRLHQQDPLTFVATTVRQVVGGSGLVAQEAPSADLEDQRGARRDASGPRSTKSGLSGSQAASSSRPVEAAPVSSRCTVRVISLRDIDTSQRVGEEGSRGAPTWRSSTLSRSSRCGPSVGRQVPLTVAERFTEDPIELDKILSLADLRGITRSRWGSASSPSTECGTGPRLASLRGIPSLWSWPP